MAVFSDAGVGRIYFKGELKMIKMALTEWHLSHTHNLPRRIDSLKKSISLLEFKGEVEELTEEEVDGLHGLYADLYSLSRVNASISWKQARMPLLCEGDANSKYFHAIMSCRRRRNVISSILVDGDRVEGVFDVREAVFKHLNIILCPLVFIDWEWIICISASCHMRRALP